ncbi:MAG: ABC transporter permease [Acidobacteriota bacterium]|nr:ABC transporter permease [Acidobacteriota bacterium]
MNVRDLKLRARALARFGPVPLAADECRDARGTAFVDNTVRDILYAFRTFQRAPLVSLTIVSTVALGLGLVAVAFTVLNMFLFRVDQVPGVDEMFAVERPRTSDGERLRFTRAQFDALRRDTQVFTDAYAENPDIDGRVDGRMMTGTLVTGNFFQVVRVNAAIGRALTPADDEAGQPVMVLSHNGWDRQFARDPAILGRGLLVNGVTFEIVGVMPEGFRGLAVGPPDYWAPLSMLGQVRPIHRGREASVGLDIVGRLKPGMSRQTALAGLTVWDAGRSNARPGERRASDITLVPRRGTVPQPLEAMLLFAPLFFAFGLILLIGCANVANLLLARAVARQREIGIRLSLGATRRRIVRQLLTESLLLALVAAAAGFAISRVALEAIIYGVMTSMAADIGDVRLAVPDADWRVLLFLIIGAGVSTVFFGLAPALQATRIEPIRTIRGEVARDARPGRARNFLIALQVSASALLLISAAVFLRSAFASATVDPGMRTSDTVIVEIVNEPTRNAMVQAVTADPSVAAVAASWPDMAAPPRAAFAETGGAKATVAYKFVSSDYFSVLDIAVVRGRTFMPSERTSRLSIAVVSETTARALWPNGDAVGQVMRLDPDPDSETRRVDDLSAVAPGAKVEPPLESRTFTVVGVVRDVAGFRIMADVKEAGVYVPASAAMAETSLVVRVHGDPELARQTLLNRLTTIDPSMGQVLTMRTMARMETYFLQIAFWLTVVLGGLALALTLSGLFGVLSYLVEQRTKEIGVRMALGATTHDVTRLVLSQSIRPVVFGLVIGGGSAAGLAALLLATPAAATIGEIVHVLDPVAYAVSLLIIIAACLVAAAIPASRAARLDPANTLRQD